MQETSKLLMFKDDVYKKTIFQLNMTDQPLSPQASSQLNFQENSSRQALLGNRIIMSQLSRSYSNALDHEPCQSSSLKPKSVDAKESRSFLR